MNAALVPRDEKKVVKAIVSLTWDHAYNLKRSVQVDTGNCMDMKGGGHEGGMLSKGGFTEQ